MRQWNGNQQIPRHSCLTFFCFFFCIHFKMSDTQLHTRISFIRNTVKNDPLNIKIFNEMITKWHAYNVYKFNTYTHTCKCKIIISISKTKLLIIRTMYEYCFYHLLFWPEFMHQMKWWDKSITKSLFLHWLLCVSKLKTARKSVRE